MSGLHDGTPVRVPYVARCELRGAGKIVSGLICNFSALGCYLHVDPVLEGEFDLSFPLPDGGPPAKARAAVTWVNATAPASATAPPVGCGVRFVLMSQSDRKRVEALVEAFRFAPTPLLGVEQPQSQAVRIPLIAPCTLEGDFGIARGSTCNLSIFGVYAAVDPIPQSGTRVRMSLVLPRRETPLERSATVTWHNLGGPNWVLPLPPGCGVRFDDLSLKEIRFLSSLVEECLEQASSG